jgi:carboxypeptidase family protein/TonB-dependent receptor-like protein
LPEPLVLTYRLIVTTCLFAVLGLGVCQAQASVGGVEGWVVDEVGRPLAAAQVRVERPGTVPVNRAMTGTDGAWRITHLEPGRYQVTVQRLGYRVVVDEVEIESGRTARLRAVLEPVPFTLDSLVVSAPALSISTATAELGSRLTMSEISLLPKTVDARQLIALTPGARPDQIWGGASDQANSYVLDGTSVNHAGLGGAFFVPSPTWIETLEVRGLGTGAEWGNFQGGLVELTTLEGGNVLQGGLRTGVESFRINGTNLIPGEIGRELASRWEVDGQVRGPLVRDRLHFAVFGQVLRQEELVLDQLAGSRDRFVLGPPYSWDGRWLAKLSWKPGGRDLFQGSVMGRQRNGERIGRTGYESAEASQQLRHRNLTGNLTWQRSWSPQIALEVRLGGYVSRERLDPYAGIGVPGIELLTTVNPPRYQNTPFQTRAEPSSLGFTTIWTLRGRLAGLEQEVKLGGEYILGSWRFVQLRNSGMTWRPLRVLGFDPANPQTWSFSGTGSGGIGTGWGGEVRLDSDVKNGAVFVQDYIQLTHSLRLNPGLRLGWWSGGLTPLAGGARFSAVRDQALDPRVGLVVDLDGRGGFVAKAHWGRYHQSLFAALFDRVDGAGAFNNEEIWSYLGPAPVDPTTTFSVAERDSLAAAGLFRFEEQIRLDQAGRVEHYRQPYVDQAMLSLERSFGSRWKAGLVYVHRRNHNQVALVDRNLAANYTVVDRVQIRDRLHRPVDFGGGPLVVERLAISNEDILWVLDLLRQGLIFCRDQICIPPGLDPAKLAFLQYNPDFVLTTVPQATRRFDQVQLRVDARYRTWWAGAWATLSWLKGNFNVVSGPDDYTNGGPGPWVRPNEQYNYFGALNNQSRLDGKVYVGGLLRAGFRGGASLSVATGDRVTPTLQISGLLSEYALVVPNPSDPTAPDTVPLHPFLLRSINGHRLFVQPRGTYRYEARTSLDLHLERGFPVGRTELVMALDGFNVLGDRSVAEIQTAVDAAAGFFGSDYGRVRSRVPPRTLRLGVGVKF